MEVKRVTIMAGSNTQALVAIQHQVLCSNTHTCRLVPQFVLAAAEVGEIHASRIQTLNAFLLSQGNSLDFSKPVQEFTLVTDNSVRLTELGAEVVSTLPPPNEPFPLSTKPPLFSPVFPSIAAIRSHFPATAFAIVGLLRWSVSLLHFPPPPYSCRTAVLAQNLLHSHRYTSWLMMSRRPSSPCHSHHFGHQQPAIPEFKEPEIESYVAPVRRERAFPEHCVT